MDPRVVGEQSDAVLRTAMPGGDDLSKLKEKPKMNRTKPPFRADHVGSLLRPASIHEARALVDAVRRRREEYLRGKKQEKAERREKAGKA